MESLTHKRCSKCKEVKPLDEFVKDNRKKYGRGSHCCACKSKAGSDWVKRNPEKHNAYYRGKPPKRKKPVSPEVRRAYAVKEYGITVTEYNEMLNEQNGLCAICGSDNKGKTLHIDHEHKTRKVRRLLCRDCNLAIGFAREDVGILEKIIGYLKSFT
jgi:hypothetical protein